MSFSLGIVGLPNVGKSTLFNALTSLSPSGGSPEGRQVPVANYPFTTIEPHVGVVSVPDERLEALAKLEKPSKIIPTTIQFVDIAGLVKNANLGEGLGNQFLSHIREVDAIVEVVRVFEDANVIHVEGKVDPKRDVETIETELVLADLQLVEKKIENLKSAAKSGRHEDLVKAGLGQNYYDALAAGKLANSVTPTEEEQRFLHEFPLLTRKPMLYVGNVKQNSPSLPLFNQRGGRGEFVALDCQLESEISQLPESERQDYLKELGLAESGLEKLIKASYKLLNLVTFFTRESQILQAWTCRTGTKTPQAAGLIHTDFEKGFIKAEVINWQKLIEAGGWHEAHAKGLIRTEGKDYTIQDGDVVQFRFNG